MKRSGTPAFVLTLPLVVKLSKDRNLIEQMEAGRRLTNATFQRLSKKVGFTSAVLITFARTGENEAKRKDRLGSNVAQRIAEFIFAAVQQYAFESTRTLLF